MDTPEEIEREEWYSQIYEEISTEAVLEFSYDRLRSYYLKNPKIAQNAFYTYLDGIEILSQHPTAAILLFVTSIEVALKSVLLKPVIYGLVHNESVADLISDLAVRNNGLDRFNKILDYILSEYSGINIQEHRIKGHKVDFLKELKSIQDVRNGISHRADRATHETAKLAEEIATEVIYKLVGGVLIGLGFSLEEDGTIST
ncbi:hypothetical protein [Paludibacterium purpuratum]|uniref:RiboL-PSP-HEPN domain-containing protein n=1 Tax=Paludibacterium purpuratum TaxID=1144873 RepID=A0A4R7AX10_9NEIS|nr:hypothetical protein [Paludibacterium purpuratum]TDR70646.1 hypothetical protein DFP86_12248 [Paludibacterium purpuratum]